MRPPEVFVRSLSHHEAVRLKRMSTRAEHQSTRIRAAILLASTVRTPVPQIARVWLTGEPHVRTVIHRFNEGGFDGLRLSTGRATPPDHRRRASARDRGGRRPPRQPRVPLTRWSLDREYEARAARVLELYASYLNRIVRHFRSGPRVRLQQHRLPQLGCRRQSRGRRHHAPQRRRPRPPNRRPRTRTPSRITRELATADLHGDDETTGPPPRRTEPADRPTVKAKRVIASVGVSRQLPASGQPHHQ